MVETPPDYAVVVPTIGRPSLTELLASLDRATGPLPFDVVLVDDRADSAEPLQLGELGADLRRRVRVVSSGGRGPAAARNAGWRSVDTEWVVFVDDDVVLEPDWRRRLARDLATAPPDVGAIQARLRVPLPSDRRPTDWERNVQRLQTAPWVTADMACRRRVLEEIGGFDERFERAFREDTDLVLRIRAGGHRIVRGTRPALHPARPAGPWVSVSLQRGNADDVLMRALHGRWKTDAEKGRFPLHLATVASGLVGVGALLARNRRVAAVAGVAWFAATADLAWRRIAPGPRDREEIARMAATSVVIPFAAVFWRVVGLARRRRLLTDTARAPRSATASRAEEDVTAAIVRGPSVMAAG